MVWLRRPESSSAATTSVGVSRSRPMSSPREHRCASCNDLTHYPGAARLAESRYRCSWSLPVRLKPDTTSSKTALAGSTEDGAALLEQRAQQRSMTAGLVLAVASHRQ